MRQVLTHDHMSRDWIDLSSLVAANHSSRNPGGTKCKDNGTCKMAAETRTCIEPKRVN